MSTRQPHPSWDDRIELCTTHNQIIPCSECAGLPQINPPRPEKVHPMSRMPTTHLPDARDCCTGAAPQRAGASDFVAPSLTTGPSSSHAPPSPYDLSRLELEHRYEQACTALREIIDFIEEEPHAITERIGTILRIARSGTTEPLTQIEGDEIKF